MDVLDSKLLLKDSRYNLSLQKVKSIFTFLTAVSSPFFMSKREKCITNLICQRGGNVKRVEVYLCGVSCHELFLLSFYLT